ncbi:glycosyltransferase family 2 protein [Parapedomonas caeni]
MDEAGAQARAVSPTQGAAGIAYSILIPCYNERNAIAATIEAVRSACTRDLPAGSFEVIVIDDGSVDQSGDVVAALAADDHRIRLIRHRRNRGYGAALKTGLMEARGGWIAITDADGTYPNERLGELFAQPDADMVVGARIGDDVVYSRLRRIPKIFLRFYAQWITQSHIPDINSGFRAFRADIARRYIMLLPDGFSFTTTITIAMFMENLEVIYEPISYAPRIGRSKIKPIRDTLRFVSTIARTGMYFAPLRVLKPFILTFWAAALVSLGYDMFVLSDLTDKTTTSLLLALNTTMLGLLADLIDRRTRS